MSKYGKYKWVLMKGFFFLYLSLNIAFSADYLSPSSIARSPDEKVLYIACSTAAKVIAFNVEKESALKTYQLKENPSAVAVSPDGKYLFAGCPSSESAVYVIDIKTGKTVKKLKAGHTVKALLTSPNGKKLYAINQFNNNVSEFDVESGKELRKFQAVREPIASDISPDGKLLLIANHLPMGRADTGITAAVITIIDLDSGNLIKSLQLPNGSTDLNDIKISPDGRYACVTHLLSRFHLPTTQLDRGWMNTNAKTIVDLKTLKILNTVLLDNVDKGAANPWAIGWTADGKYLCVTHSGTHEVSVINFPMLIDKLSRLPEQVDQSKAADYITVSKTVSDVPNDLSFLVGLRTRLKLSDTDKGPRSIAVVGARIYVANYFTDTLSVAEINTQNPQFKSIILSPQKEWTTVRKGEFYFYDASICFQGWQTCASCHPDDGRVDGLNWDLLNDGIGNPKNTRSLLLSHKTPPAMSLGIRETAYTAVRSGIKSILFTVQKEDVPHSIDEYLKSLKPVPSPYLVKGNLSKSASRGKKIFNQAGCAECHPSPLFTNMKQYNVGTKGEFDKPSSLFDTPTLIEVWRTAPYLHDGSAATLKEVFTVRNKDNQHGITQNLSDEQLNDLIEYILSI